MNDRQGENSTTPKVGDRVVHAGVTTTTKYDASGTRTTTKESFRDKGVLLDIGQDDRCIILCDDGVEVDNIYIGALQRWPERGCKSCLSGTQRPPARIKL